MVKYSFLVQKKENIWTYINMLTLITHPCEKLFTLFKFQRTKDSLLFDQENDKFSLLLVQKSKTVGVSELTLLYVQHEELTELQHCPATL